MKRIVVATLAALSAFAGRPDTEIVDGIEWTYAVRDGKAVLENGVNSVIPEETGGVIAIPSKLGGFPVAEIGRWAFTGCRGITELTMSDSVELIENHAFFSCTGLERVEIGVRVSEIGNSAFYGCSSLSAFVVAAGNPAFAEVDGMLLSKDGKTLVRGVNGDANIPEGVSSIATYAFSSCSGLTSVTFPGSLGSIGRYAFDECANLASVKISEGVKSIARLAFSNCSSLTNVTIAGSVAEIGHNAFDNCNPAIYDTKTVSGVRLVDGWAVSAAENISGTVNMAGVRGIADETFLGRTGITGVMLADTVTYVGGRAFFGCTNMVELSVGAAVVHIETNAFEKCESLARVHVLSRENGVWNYEFFKGQKPFVLDGCGGVPRLQRMLLARDAEAGDLPGVSLGLHRFMGWFPSVDGGVRLVETSVPKADATYYARWRYVGKADERHIYLDDDIKEEYVSLSDGTFVLDLGAGIQSYSEPVVAVTGLPSGLKFDKKKNLISGKATKPGIYKVKISVTNETVVDPVELEMTLTVQNLKWNEAAVGVAPADMYLLQAGVPPELSDVISAIANSGWKLSMSGLPSGVAYDAKAGKLKGLATKEGVYTVYFTATKGKDKQQATAFFNVVYPAVSIAVVGSDGAGASHMGKVTGMGKYAFGKKVSAKATANKGYVFTGWESPTHSIDANPLQSTISFAMPLDDVALVAKFVTAVEDKASINLAVGGTALPYAAAATPVWTNYCGVAVSVPVESGALSDTTVKVSGLPAGVRLVQDKVTKAYSLAGAPTAASRADKKTGAMTPSKVKFTVTTAGKSSQTFFLDWTILPLPAWAVGTFDGDVRAGNPVPAVSGTVSLTIAANGKISGKLLESGKTWTLSAESFSAVEGRLSDVDNLTFRATVVGKAGKETVSGEIVVAAQAMTADPIYRGVAAGTLETSNSQLLGVYALQNLWKTEPWKTDAKPFAKAPKLTPDLFDGGTITLKFANTGAVTASAKFATGKDAKGKDVVYSATCTSALIPIRDPELSTLNTRLYDVVLYFPPKAGKFEGRVLESRLAWDGVNFAVHPTE